ncbi:hypothetical protein RSAG8_04383, partial [Rhizoctonia solani AG-8 WAC10335]
MFASIGQVPLHKQPSPVEGFKSYAAYLNYLLFPNITFVIWFAYRICVEWSFFLANLPHELLRSIHRLPHFIDHLRDLIEEYTENLREEREFRRDRVEPTNTLLRTQVQENFDQRNALERAWHEQVDVIENQNLEITNLNEELRNTRLTNEAYQDQLEVLQERAERAT